MSAAAGADAPAGAALVVYGVVDPGAAPPAAAGISGGVEPLEEAGVAALVGRVVLGDEPLEQRLQDPAWVEAAARAHAAVLDQALREGAVVPFRLLTLWTDEAELRRFLGTRARELRGVLDRVRGRVELGVKAFVDLAAFEAAAGTRSEAVAALDAQIEAADPGRAYLLGRRRATLAREEAAAALRELARGCYGRLAAAAEDAVANPPQPRELSGRGEEMILNGAYLVARGDEALEAAVADLAERHRAAGVAFELTGPWPPYNFVPRDLGET